MKKGSEYYVFKQVYRSISGIYYRKDHIGNFFALALDYPIIDRIASNFPSFKVVMYESNRETTAWKDKHNNVIVRVIDKCIIQSKTNF